MLRDLNVKVGNVTEEGLTGEHTLSGVHPNGEKS